MKTQAVLIVDPDLSSAEAIAVAFSNSDLHVLVAADYQTALHLVAERGHELSLVIADTEQPGLAHALLIAIQTYREELPVLALAEVETLAQAGVPRTRASTLLRASPGSREAARRLTEGREHEAVVAA